MSDSALDIESLLRQAFAPVEPSAELEARLESTLNDLWQTAQEELDAWELSAMRDPRNWVRPAAAIVAGSAAGAALVLLRARRRGQSSSGPLGVRLPPLDRAAAERTLRDFGRETRKLFGER